MEVQLYRPLLGFINERPVYGTLHAIKKFMTKRPDIDCIKKAEDAIRNLLLASTDRSPLKGVSRKKESWHSMVRSINHGDTIFRYCSNLRFVLVPTDYPEASSFLLVTIENLKPSREVVEREKVYLHQRKNAS